MDARGLFTALCFQINSALASLPKRFTCPPIIELLQKMDPGAVWMIAGLQVNLLQITTRCLANGGHIRTGLEDAPFGFQTGNVELVSQTAHTIIKDNYEIGTAAQFRKSLHYL